MPDPPPEELLTRTLHKLRPTAGAPAGGRARWISLALVALLAGAVVVYVRAGATSHYEGDKARLSFRLTANEIAARLKLAIQHEEDLVVSASALVAANPQVTPAQFDLWATSVRAFSRYPELKNLGLVAYVPAAELSAFEAHARAAPLRPFGAQAASHEPFQLLPAGTRPYYCLATAGIARGRSTFLPVGLDYCYFAHTLIGTRDSGVSLYAPVMLGGGTALGIETPVYRGGATPATVAGRHAAFLGWLGEVIVPEIVVSRALDGHRGVAVTFSYAGNGTSSVFHAGTSPRHAQSTTIDLHNGWTVQAFAAAPGEGVFATGRSRTVMIGGALICVLIALLTYVLGTGRSRALALVREKTRELSHQAMHDTLTGLPNRALVLDRAEQMLSRAARHREVLAGALYIDIDGFKHVNDNLGHAAGDELLEVVAQRLLEVVREQDTVGRLGGDEFVVLVEHSGRGRSPELLAARLIAALRQPIQLRSVNKVLSFTASVGIAFGKYAAADELLRDADLALYAAKAAGKDRYALFEPGMGGTASDPDAALAAELSAAALGDQLTLRYRPLLDVSGERLLGVEAMIHWQHPRLGLLTGERFLGIAEETGLIISIGRWARAEACRQAVRCDAEENDLRMCIRLSPRELRSAGLVADVAAALDASGLDPAHFTLAVSESAVNADLAGASERISQLKALGVRVVIDGFGGAYAALAAIGSVPADVLKLDDELLARAGHAEGRELLDAVAAVGRALAVPLTAEGVMFDERLLRELVGDSAEGFVAGEPLSAQRLEEVVALRAARMVGPQWV